MFLFFLRVTPELRSGKYDASRGGGGECEGRVAKYLSIGHIQYWPPATGGGAGRGGHGPG